jgi:ATP-dependent Clp endopeptidase proteolytic subunit ClpP
MKISKDHLEIYFEYGVDVSNRCIFMTNEVDHESIGHVVKGLYMMDNQNQKHDPIELRICSYGGNVYDMFALHDVTRTLKSPVHTMGMGKVMSAAVLLVACGKQGNRWAGENTSFMIHMPSWDSEDQKLHDHRVDVKEVERLWDRWYKLMAAYTTKDSKFWRDLCNRRDDVFFDAQEAQEWGIIDHIWDEKG